MQVRASTGGLALLLAGLGGCDGGSTGSTPSKTPLSHFEFKGLIPKVTTVEEAMKANVIESCRSYMKGETSCDFKKYEVGDVSVGGSSIIFKDDKFDWFTVEYTTDNFEQMAEILRKVYGKPCAIDSKPLQNAYGAQFSGDEILWCLAEGDLTLRRHKEDNFRLGELDYFTKHSEDEKPEALYNANTL